MPLDIRSLEEIHDKTESQPTDLLRDDRLAVEFGCLPVPRRMRYDPQSPPHFGLGMNLILGLTAAFAAANISYTQPLLIELAKDFDLTLHDVATIPALSQAGFAIGLLFICPLGDLFRRRQLIIGIVFTAASMSIGLAVTSDLIVFEVLSFFVALFSVVTQIIVPLVVDLAPPKWCSSAISIVFAGITLGTLLARAISGVVAQYVTWRVAFYIAVGAQYGLCAVLYWILPDYPAKNKDESYLRILISMAKYAVTEPTLVQAILINIASSGCTASFWVTLTFLLGEPPYNYSTLIIGLFALIGIFGLLMSPFVGWGIDKLTPWYGILIANAALLATYVLQTGAIGLHVSVVVIITVAIDVFRQTQNVSLASHVLTLESNARARLNSVLMVSLFLGSVMGTSVGSKVFTQSGWRASGALSVAWTVFALVVLLLRGPHVPRYTWFGWRGGYKPVRRKHTDLEGALDAEHGHDIAASTNIEGKEQDTPNKDAAEVASQSVEDSSQERNTSDR
ncbi:major facilitator superfamily domain-containing protein [Cerioporus squamosus]|nr:major facilitator superfamily domain-containing protein [Cerioporus squamosus]